MAGKPNFISVDRSNFRVDKPIFRLANIHSFSVASKASSMLSEFNVVDKSSFHAVDMSSFVVIN